MPGIVTHYAFGREVYRELAGVIGLGKLERESFLLGNLGPDPFLYIDAVLPKGHRLRGIGSAMHKQNTERLLTAVHDEMVVADGAMPEMPAPGRSRWGSCAITFWTPRSIRSSSPSSPRFALKAVAACPARG